MATERVGFETPRPATDQVVAKIYQEHSLGSAPAMKDIEPVATVLLGNPLTLIEGVQLVLNR